MGIEKYIKGKYHKQYYKKHFELPTLYDSVGRMSFIKQEEILKEAIQKDKTWREVANQNLEEGMIL